MAAETALARAWAAASGAKAPSQRDVLRLLAAREVGCVGVLAAVWDELERSGARGWPDAFDRLEPVLERAATRTGRSYGDLWYVCVDLDAKAREWRRSVERAREGVPLPHVEQAPSAEPLPPDPPCSDPECEAAARDPRHLHCDVCGEAVPWLAAPLWETVVDPASPPEAWTRRLLGYACRTAGPCEMEVRRTRPRT